MTARETPPRFFVDRSLGRTVTSSLRALGWDVVDLAAVYPNDAQEIDDDEWIRWGSAQGWAMLSKDHRIRYRPAYRQATRPIFALRNGNLPLRTMVQWFEASRAGIWASAPSGRREFWYVYELRTRRADPAEG